MFIALVVPGRRGQVRLKASGRFWCLRCEAERDYQHREWRSAGSVYLMPTETTGGEFVLCVTCENTYTLECLDESSTALYQELLADAPVFAIEATLRRRPRGIGEDTAAAQFEVPAAAPRQARPRLSEVLSGNSASRRH